MARGQPSPAERAASARPRPDRARPSSRPPDAAGQAADAGRPAPGRPVTVAAAALVQVLQSAVVLAAAVLAGLAAGQGRSYQGSGGIAITVIGFCTAVLCVLVAVGLARMRRWSRTPALLTQLFTGIIGIDLVQGHRYWWGVPLLALALAGFALLLAPPSLRALAARSAGQA